MIRSPKSVSCCRPPARDKILYLDATPSGGHDILLSWGLHLLSLVSGWIGKNCAFGLPLGTKFFISTRRRPGGMTFFSRGVSIYYHSSTDGSRSVSIHRQQYLFGRWRRFVWLDHSSESRPSEVPPADKMSERLVDDRLDDEQKQPRTHTHRHTNTRHRPRHTCRR